MALKLSNNSKTKFKSEHLNTFGLPFGSPATGGTCPGATYGPGGCLNVSDGRTTPTCYMAKVTRIYKNVAAALDHNFAKLEGKDYDELIKELQETVDEFKRINKGENLYFRLHYSGDFYSLLYAEAWAYVIRQNPDVRFWVYTRSHKPELNVVPILADCPNLSLYLSCDPVNFSQALCAYAPFEKYPNVGLAWMGSALPKGFRFARCPETYGVIKNKPERGACAECRLCIDRFKTKINNISFAIH
jgi:hypothetical protein